MAEFKDMLKYLRKRKNYSQQELADKLGISKSAVSMYENGKRQPDFETLECIADLFNVDMNFLIPKSSSDPSEVHELDSYYLNDDARDMAEFLFKNPDYKVLFDASRKVKPENLELVKQIIEKFGGTD